MNITKPQRLHALSIAHHALIVFLAALFFSFQTPIGLPLLALPCAWAAVSPFTSDQIREPVVAGTWYPKDPGELRKEIDGFLGKVPLQDIPGRLTTLVAPHAGYDFSGQVAAYAYKSIQNQKFDTVVVIGPSHFYGFSGVSVYDRGGFKTPLGIVPLDRDLIAALEKRESRIRYIPEAHAQEHSLESQLPFLQTMLPAFKLVPLVMGDQDLSTCNWLADALRDSIKGKSVLVVASSDLSHYHPYERAKELDRLVIEKINSFDPVGLAEALSAGKCEACGGGPIIAAMLLARASGATAGKVLDYANSGDVTGDRGRVVGYLAAAFWTDGKPEGALDPRAKRTGVDLGLTAEEKAFLHKVVKETIENRCRGLGNGEFKPPAGALNEPRGAFVTIHKHKDLRGCIGQITAVRPLVETVAEMADAAAFRDPRFPPVTVAELPDLEYEISVLTPLHLVRDVSEIQVGVHGIYMKQGMRSGLLLPQVATEYGWDRNSFLENTCRKAGLPDNAWKDKSTEIYIFSADIF